MTTSAIHHPNALLDLPFSSDAPNKSAAVGDNVVGVWVGGKVVGAKDVDAATVAAVDVIDEVGASSVVGANVGCTVGVVVGIAVGLDVGEEGALLCVTGLLVDVGDDDVGEAEGTAVG